MREIGLRELKRSLSETLQAVGRGELVRATVRGHPVADIVPAGATTGDSRLRQLVAAGRIVPPSRARPAQAPTPAPAPTSASALLLAERDAER